MLFAKRFDLALHRSDELGLFFFIHRGLFCFVTGFSSRYPADL
jgi:hypothetical protein